MSDDDITTTQGLAIVGLALVLLVPLAAGVAYVIKRRFAAAVVQLQLQTAQLAHTPPADTAPDARLVRAMQGVVAMPPPLPPPVAVATAASFETATAAAPARRLRAKVLTVQLIFGWVLWIAVLFMMLVTLFHTEDITTADTGAVQSTASAVAAHLVMWPMLLTPALLAWAIQAGARSRWVGLGFGAAIIILGLGSAIDGSVSWSDASILMAVVAGLGGVLMTFMRPSVRGAGPPLIAASTMAWLAMCAWAGLAILASELEADAGAGVQDESLSAVDWVVLAAMMLFSLWVGWRTLKRIAQRYAQKRFSEVQLALATYWGLILALGMSFVLATSFMDNAQEAGVAVVGFTLLLFWWLWRATQGLALRWLMRRAPEPLPPLLLLRVFKPSARSEEFMDRFLARWRFAAPVWMIAGPDLAGAYMEPDEFFLFMRRRLQERFITRVDEVPERIEALDQARDPDGRFRVNDLYCSNTTWKATASALIDRAGVIVLDLREYTRQRAGTRFELRELLERATLGKLIVLVDERDGAVLVEEEVKSLWQDMVQAGTTHPNIGTLRVLTLGADSDAQLKGLINAVSDTAAKRGQAETIQPSMGSMAMGRP
jgi:hypothetical protein